ncbi:MAG: L,D-transpeptidase [Lachnospiraceae bacterium]|nr:L,D-transpeptidase [Lachnospiraceae bacterium]
MDKNRRDLFGYEDEELITVDQILRDRLVKRKNKKIVRRGAIVSLMAAIVLFSGGAIIYTNMYGEHPITSVAETKGALSSNAENKTASNAPSIDQTLATEAQENGEANIKMDDTVNTGDYPYLVRVNRKLNVVNVYSKDENGNYTVPFKAMVCSVGLNDATPTGTFKTSTKYEWHALYENTFGQYAYRIDGPIMFHSVPYTAEKKDALEIDEFNKLGEPASLGCVRLCVADAKWLCDNCPEGTTVEIFDSKEVGPFGKPGCQKIENSSEMGSWDPTDSDEANPWRSR